MPPVNHARPFLDPPTATVSAVDSPAVPVAPATNRNPPKNLEDLAESVRQLEKILHAANSHIASLLNRLAIVESNLAMLQYAPKPVWTMPAPMPYCPPANPYIEPWKTPPWLPDIMLCAGQEQGKPSDCFQ